MASPTQWTWVWASCGSWWWTGRAGVLRFMGSQPDTTEQLKGTELIVWIHTWCLARYFSSPHRELARRRHRAHSASRFVGFSDEEGTPDSCSTWTLLIKYSECWAEKRLPLKRQMFKSHALGHSTLPLCCCCCSVAKLCPTLCNPMDCSTPGSSVRHCLPEFAQIHVSWAGVATQPSPSAAPSPFASISPSSRVFPVSCLFTPGGRSSGASASASVLPVNIQGWFPLGWTGSISLQSKGLSRVFWTNI